MSGASSFRAKALEAKLEEHDPALFSLMHSCHDDHWAS